MKDELSWVSIEQQLQLTMYLLTNTTGKINSQPPIDDRYDEKAGLQKDDFTQNRMSVWIIALSDVTDFITKKSN